MQCGYPVRDENSIIYRTQPCGDPNVIDTLEIDLPEGKHITVGLCERHYYMALKLHDWQVAQLVRDGVFK